MTWHAARGLVVLDGAEAIIFAQVIQDMMAEILAFEGENGTEIFRGPKLFNDMTATQQASSLLAVANALYRKTRQCLPLTAWSEATLAAILAGFRDQLICEIDTDSGTDIRDFLNSQLEDPINSTSNQWNDTAEWSDAFEIYESQFLWDKDYEIEQLLDVSPDISKLVADSMGVNHDYYAAIPPDINERELTDVADEIHSLLRKWLS